MTTTASTPISRVAARILIETQSVLFKPDRLSARPPSPDENGGCDNRGKGWL